MGGGQAGISSREGREGAKVAAHAMTIAQPFMAGSGVNKMKKSREGRQKNRVGCPQWWPCAAPFVPGGTLTMAGISPSHEWLGYFPKTTNAASGAPSGLLSGNAQNVAQAFGHDAAAVGEYQSNHGVCIFRRRQMILLLRREKAILTVL